MPSLISPNVSVTIIDESFYVPGRTTTVPVIFIATEERKYQSDGQTPALGTYEYHVVREVTSIRQSLELYGIPRFIVSSSGEPHHGDARNEYGLDALNKVLEVGNRALVVRANVNLNDNYTSLKTLWSSEVLGAADYLNQLAGNLIDQNNTTNGYVPADTEYKESITQDEMKSLVNEAFTDTFQLYNFSSYQFQDGFLLDHKVPHPGYQEVLFDTSYGFLQTTDVTGVNNDNTLYGADVEIENVTYNLYFAGSTIQTFGALLTQINAAISGGGVAELISGNIRITSDFDGVTSSVTIEDGVTGYLPLFGYLNLFTALAESVPGVGSATLNVYDDTFTTVIANYDGLTELIESWVSGAAVSTEFTPDEAEGLVIAAAAEYDNTKEFLNTTALGVNDVARRAEIVVALQGAVNNPASNITAESYIFNIAVCPGYFEVTDELERLSQRIYDEVFWIGESPFDKPPTGPNSIVLWATSLVGGSTRSYNGAIYYPHGISSNIDGENIMTSAASTALRVYAYNDTVAEQWYAPAGIRRGTCPHLTSIGYVTGALGGPTTWVVDWIDEGTRDSLYEFPKNINPIIFKAGSGILVLGQTTQYGAVSALSDVNVSRLVKYIKRQLRTSLFAFLFEPNDQRTRDQVKFTADGFLGSMIDRRGLYDFATVCDNSNNTPDSIDRKELWLNVAIKPVRAVEFIYVPIRVVATGADI
jgi:hypothetical protein